MKNLFQSGQKTLYRAEYEHDACGVGVVANIKGIASHQIVKNGIEVLVNLAHRGAAGSDPETGDGAGLLLQIPDTLMRKEASRLGFNLPGKGQYAIGVIFLPQDKKESELCLREIESALSDQELSILGWRDVPTNPSAIGKDARKSQPQIKHLFVTSTKNVIDEVQFERQLFISRKIMENQINELGLKEPEDFYVCSLSSKLIVYKGLLLSNQVSDFFTDLSNPEMASSFALVHSRFSTNTLGSWRLAHPYRYLVHNGEINTHRGNINWMNAREKSMSSPYFGDDIQKIFPIIQPGQSDTASLDNAFELMLQTGRSIQHVMMSLVPEATGERVSISQEKRDFYEYHACMMEPWDGPALVAFTDGNRIGAVLDRNGLRPFRYVVTNDDRLIMASEVGVLDIPPSQIILKERIRPGRMFLLDPDLGGIVDDETIKSDLSNSKPYGKWLHENQLRIEDLPNSGPTKLNVGDSFTRLLKLYGYTNEELKMLIEPMLFTGSEATGSMGNDVPLAILSEQPQLLFNYFKQLFAQVSNPPLDAIREELVTSLVMRLGAHQNIFTETPKHAEQLRIKTPIVNNSEMSQIQSLQSGGVKTKTLSAVFEINQGEGSLEKAMGSLCKAASKAIDEGYSILVLSDRQVDSAHAPIPSLLSVAGVHHHLIREGTRTKASIVVESGEPREVAHLALLVGYGASAVNPYLIYDLINDLVSSGDLPDRLDMEALSVNYVKAANKGLLKIISKMGISTTQSYHGAQIFEAVGLSQELVDRYFTWTASRIGGVGLDALQKDILDRHKKAYPLLEISSSQDLEIGGAYQWRRDGEYHMWNPNTIAKLQYASRMNDPGAYEAFATLANNYERQFCTLRGLLGFKQTSNPIPIEEVEPSSEILKRFATGAISLGAISREAHESMAIAMNRIGARSNSGEGGEDPRRYIPDANGDRRFSAIKQVASGRFGVTTNYLVNATDLQIKMAQGAKPGEGGQLPGHKVDDYIGWIRHSTPGVELISPPPHHDIYSIEDLAQLIHDLKNVNPSARIHVKLVAEVGVGTIAAGVSKAHGDVVLISGDSGGTGASPESSIKHAGLPWELGIAETQQVLVANNLRGRIVVQADGQLKTGRDVAIACLLGADEFGIATAALITQGCIMLRKCHLNTCSVGVATQDPELRKQFTGQPEHLINYFTFVAEELREIMSQLGFRSIDEMVGRVDKLETSQVIDHWWKTKGIDLSELLAWTEASGDVSRFANVAQDHGLEHALDNKLIELSQNAINNKASVSINLPISNANRTVGAMLSGEIAKQYGEQGLPHDSIKINFSGSAGQSFGAFLSKGINIQLSGDANDYFGKGMSGGVIAVKPPLESPFIPEENIIIGNVGLYGATGGEVFIRGLAGERFCVRNSGASAVVEGVGDHGAEYMTNGRLVILGQTGRNFAAGMSGGIAYILDEDGHFSSRCNQEMVDLEALDDPDDIAELKGLIQAHFDYTGSSNAERIINSWPKYIEKFTKVYPRDYRRVIEDQKKLSMEAPSGG